jgi:hypothetical protein
MILMWMRRSFVAIISAIIVLSALVPQASACVDDDDEHFRVEFESGSYHDLDSDGYVDDIKTVFSLEAEYYVYVTFVYTRLFFPSGRMLDLYLMLIGNFEEVVITIGWFNCLQESGWYYSDVYAKSYGSKRAGGSDWILFDPPAGGVPGGPTIEVLSIEIMD